MSGADDTSFCPARRRALETLAGVALCAALPNGEAAPVPAKLPPQVGDLLATPSWDEQPRVISPADVKAGAAPITVFPQDPASGVTREKLRLNQILLVRLDPAGLDRKGAVLHRVGGQFVQGQRDGVRCAGRQDLHRDPAKKTISGFSMQIACGRKRVLPVVAIVQRS